MTYLHPGQWAVDESMRGLAAIHEAAHGCVALSVGIPVIEICLADGPDSRGHIKPDARVCDLAPQHYVLMLLAGQAAERRAQSFLSTDLSATDRAQAREILAIALLRPPSVRWPSEDDVTNELLRWTHRAARSVDQYWAWIQRTGDALMRWGHLTGAEIVGLR